MYTSLDYLRNQYDLWRWQWALHKEKWKYEVNPVSYTHLDVYKRQPLNRSSPKTIRLENSINQGCIRNIIWFCLNLRLLSFAKKKIYRHRQTHTQTLFGKRLFHVLSVVESESAIIWNTIFFAITILPFLRNMEVISIVRLWLTRIQLIRTHNYI